MSSEEPCLSDTARQFVSKHNRLHNKQYYEHRLLIVVCCPSEQDQQDHLVLRQKASVVSRPGASLQTWRLPEIDPSELPGSTGINDSLQKIVLEYCREIFASQEGFVKLLLGTKGTSGSGRDAKPTLKIYVVVNYPQPPQLKIWKGGEKFGLKSLAWLQRNEESFCGGTRKLEILKSAPEAAEQADSGAEGAW